MPSPRNLRCSSTEKSLGPAVHLRGHLLGGSEEARIVVVNSRIMKSIGLDWFDQLEPAEGYEDLWVPPAD